MNKEKAKQLLSYSEVGDEVFLDNIIFHCEETRSHYGLLKVAKAAKELNPLIIEMEQGRRLFIMDVDDAYRTLVRTCIETLQGIVETYEGFRFDPETKNFYCRKCGQRVGWEHPDIPGHFMFSSAAEGDEREGICYECWAEEHHKEGDN